MDDGNPVLAVAVSVVVAIAIGLLGDRIGSAWVRPRPPTVE